MKGDELDRILDDALASYTLQEPRAGFTARTMARVHADGAATRWTWLRFAVATLALAGLAAAVVTWRSQSPVQNVAVVTPVQAPIAPHVPVEPVAHTAQRPRTTLISPRQESLTPEERALLAFAQQAPEAALRLAQPDKPLEIEEINIRPLQIDSLDIGEIE